MLFQLFISLSHLQFVCLYAHVFHSAIEIAIAFYLTFSEWLFIFMHPKTHQNNASITLDACICLHEYALLIGFIQFASEMENIVLLGDIFHLVTFLFPLIY